MRTFIAIEPPDDLRTALGELCRSVAEYFPGVRWAEPWNIHLTLRFLGEIDPADLDPLSTALEEAVAPTAPFELVPSKIGFFGSKLSPRVVWLGLEEQPQLKDLAGALENSLQQADFGRADKPFRGHLTLARIRRPLKRPPDWEIINQSLPEIWPGWKVTEVHIIKSTLTPQGPVYKILRNCKLAGG